MPKGQKSSPTADVIGRFRKRHGDRYDYSQVVFNGSHTKVTIICHEHGPFEQTPAIHIRGSGCPECGKIEKGQRRRKSPEQAIEEFRAVHGLRYDYTPTVYSTNRSKVTINCRIHGAFEILPDNHLKGMGCRICGLSSKRLFTGSGSSRQLTGFDPTEEFRIVHGDRYDYSQFVYKASNVSSTIICPDHGPFEQSYSVHKNGHGCSKCGFLASAESRVYSWEAMQKLFRVTHGEKYDYSRAVYKGPRTSITIICPDHGEFQQTPYAHQSGRGCSKCSSIQRGIETRKSTEWFIGRAKSVHGDRYDYTEVVYEHSRIPITVICNKHGPFVLTPTTHINDGTGCPQCSHHVSKGETDIGDFIEALGYEVVRNTRMLIPPKEVDLYVPDKSLAVEYCGLYWHSEQQGKGQDYHQDKQQTLADRGVDLITIFEDEWLDRPEVVKMILRTRLDKAPAGVGARHLVVKQIAPSYSSAFLNVYHIQGSAMGSVHLGAYHNDDLVGVMVFGQPTRQTSSYEWELKRFATNGAMYPGMMSKLFHHFIKNRNPESIVSFSDLRWFTGGSYQQLGFYKDGEIAPDYSYVRGGIRHHKSKFRKSGIKRIHPEQYDDNLTEKVMMENLGYDRIWDCGKIRWVWTRDV